MSVPRPTVDEPSDVEASCHFHGKNSALSAAAFGTVFQLTNWSAWFCTTSATKPISMPCTSSRPLPDASRVFRRVQ